MTDDFPGPDRLLYDPMPRDDAEQPLVYTHDQVQTIVAAALTEIREMALEGCVAPNAAYRWCERIDELTFSLMDDDDRAALERLMEKARREEREACADMLEQTPGYDSIDGEHPLVSRMRARGETS